jgi:hypothetical protein
MSRLPKVAEEIKYSLYRTIKDMATDKKKSAYLKGFWSGFKKDQPELAVIVRDEMENFKNAHEMGAFAHGVWLIYAALESQLEADEMNEEWGL